MIKLVHDRNGIELESAANDRPKWYAKQLMEKNLYGHWRVFDEEGDQLFTLAPAHIPRRDGGIDTAQLEALITFIVFLRTAAFDDGYKAGEHAGKDEFASTLRDLIEYGDTMEEEE